MVKLAIANGRVWGGRHATALAIDHGRIAALGRDADMPQAERVIDAGGMAILPAFDDAHVHFLMGSRSLGQLDLHGVQGQLEIERRITDHAESTTGEWVVGRGWLYSAFEGGMPTVDLLDRLVPDRPAYLESFDAHTGWANRKALALAGVPDAGILKEDAMEAVARVMPRPSRDQDLESLRAGMRVAASRGIGSVQEAGDGQRQLGLWQALHDSGELTLRMRLGFDMTPGIGMEAWVRKLREYKELRPAPGEWLSTGILKAFADGVVESHTASMLQPYANAPSLGAALWEDGELREAVRIADAAGWQIQVHAIGDAAIAQALDAFAGAAPGRRHRIEHIEVPRPADLPRFAHEGVVASMQPQHADPNLTEVWRRNLGPERAARGWPWKALAESGAHLAFGTDWPVVPLDPLASIIAAADLGLEAAIDAWTSGSAFAEHAESQKGALRKGMLADVAVVDLETGRVWTTVVGGRVVFEG